MSEMVGLFDNSSNPKMLMLSCSTYSTPASRLSVLTYLTPSAISCTSMSAAFSQSSCHVRYTLYNQNKCVNINVKLISSSGMLNNSFLCLMIPPSDNCYLLLFLKPPFGGFNVNLGLKLFCSENFILSLAMTVTNSSIPLYSELVFFSFPESNSEAFFLPLFSINIFIVSESAFDHATHWFTFLNMPR